MQTKLHKIALRTPEAKTAEINLLSQITSLV